MNQQQKMKETTPVAVRKSTRIRTRSTKGLYYDGLKDLEENDRSVSDLSGDVLLPPPLNKVDASDQPGCWIARMIIIIMAWFESRNLMGLDPDLTT